MNWGPTDMNLHDKGFTMIELLFVMLLGAFLSAAIFVATKTAIQSSSGLQEKIEAVQDVKGALNTMALEIGMASYKPGIVADSALWKSIASAGQGCALAANTANPGNRGIQEATANSITVEADLNNNSSIADPNEVIRYVYVSDGTANGEAYITRCSNGVNASAGMPFLGDTIASGNQMRSVRVINKALGINVFTYYDGNGTDITAAVVAQPAVNVPNIRRIDIKLAVETANVDPSTGQRRRIIYSTSVIPMNHAIN